MNTHTDFKTIPLGLFLIRMMHESTGGKVLHIGLKIRDGEWFNQAQCPVFSETASKSSCSEFWDWAQKNLPIYEYPNIVKAAIA